jgi:hypothetical protein
MIKVYAVKDDEGHWYVIPFEMKEEWHSDFDGLSDENWEEWEDKYVKYKTGGDLNNIQLYAKL